MLAVTQVALNLSDSDVASFFNRHLSHNELNERRESGLLADDFRRLPFLTTLSNINAAL